MSDEPDSVDAARHVLEMLERGGIWYNVPAKTVDDALSLMANKIRLPGQEDRKALLESLKAREILVPTAVGNGIAMPHPRGIFLQATDEARIGLFLFESPVDWAAADGQSVFAAFLILSTDPSIHLEALSELSRACQEEAFRKLLARWPDPAELHAWFQPAATG
jgi:PTS system nitrogen regulatory IIA component